MSGLVRKKVRVKTKGGKTILRSMMVKTDKAVTRLYHTAAKNKGKIALAGAATLAGAYLAHKNKSHLHAFRRGVGAKLGEHMVNKGGERLVDHLAEKLGGGAGARIGRALGGKTGEAIGEFMGDTAANFLGHHYASPHLEKAGKAVAKRMRRK